MTRRQLLASFASVGGASLLQPWVSAWPIGPTKHQTPEESGSFSFRRSEKIDYVLEQVRAKYDQPAMAVCVLLDDIIYCSTQGFRRDGETARVSLRDRFRFGSLTKGFTSTMFGALLERGTVNLDVTLETIFPELADSMVADYRTVTIAQVLGHQAGFSRYIRPHRVMVDGKLCELNTYDEKPLDFTRQRYEFVKNIELMKVPSTPIGTYAYADAGYVVAGAIASKITGKPWEALIQEHVFTPLNMSDSGFNFPQKGASDFPCQHIVKDGHRIVVEPEPRNSNGPLLDTTGGLYCTMPEIGRFLEAHLEGENGRDSLLRSETFRLLHQPRPGSTYGLGWNNLWWGDRRVIEHGGGNPFATAHWWLFPNERFGMCVITTEGGSADAENTAIYEVERLLEADRSY